MSEKQVIIERAAINVPAKRSNLKRLKKFKRFLKLRILHANDSPHRIALGVSTGIFVAWTPILGLHLLILAGLTILLRANKFAAFIFVWVSNPFTAIGIYYPNYLLGRILLKPFYRDRGVELEMREMFSQLGPSRVWHSIFNIEFWRNFVKFLWQRGPELWLGSIVMGVLVGVISYIIIYKIVVWYRKKAPRRRFLRYQ